MRHRDIQRTPSVDRAGKDFHADRLLHRQRLARHRRLVDVAVARRHLSVQWNLFSRLDEDHVADPDLVDRHLHDATVPTHDCLGWRQLHERPDRSAGTIHRPGFEHLRQREQKNDRRCFRPLAQRESADDRDHHQDVDVENARTCADGGAPHDGDTADDRRE